MFGALSIALLTSFATQTFAALPNISVKGAKFFANGQQFFLKGVAYQGTPADPLVDTNQCQLDAQFMKTIGTNSIRVYHVDPYAYHDGCMSAFSDAGIYIWLDLDTFNTTVAQTAPTWTLEQFEAFALVMDVFQKYDNLGGFWIGNEVINSAAGSPAAPYVKAAVADMKSYMAAKNYRTIPIGYSAADIAELRPMLQNYLACGDTQSQAIDFFGLNSYEWCGDATYDTSGYSNLQAMAVGYSVPIFFSETGCNVGGARTFQDQNAIFGPNMSGTWSGSIIYEWVQETNNYGLVNYPNGQIYSGAPTKIQPDFDNLSNVWKTLTAPNLQAAAYSPSFSAPACPLASNGWGVNGNVALPTLPAGSWQPILTNGVPVPVSTTSSSRAPTPTPTTTSTTPSKDSGTLSSSAPPITTSMVSSSMVPVPSSTTSVSTSTVLVSAITIIVASSMDLAPSSNTDPFSSTAMTTSVSSSMDPASSTTSMASRVSSSVDPATTTVASNVAASTSIPAPTTASKKSAACSLHSRRNIISTLLKNYHDVRHCIEPYEIKITAVVLSLFLSGFGIFFAIGLFFFIWHTISHASEYEESIGDHAMNSRGFRPDLCGDEGIEYKGEMDEVERILQRVGERRMRRNLGLPAGGALSGEGLEGWVVKRASSTVN